ncbi:Protein of unknown function [Sphingomonas guangdongensis]|uniref:DUF4230 domain-containing protein n=1 Tax=Sphingomonas guangdongensis TaxID=1141890 RepID=A0A285QZM4_9SPHN|nr:DUF4230 domain-containing protein [Sphingomonas guangdongensis]SOB87355.1 Protein of unknown function [Sphingomonas guangdongensis]
MAERRLNPGQLVGGAIALALLLLAAFGGKALYDRYTQDYVVTRAPDDGRAVTQVIRATFARASALKVGTLNGSVQATASDRRFAGLLTADRVIKAPFSVDYFIDVSRLEERDFRYDPATRTLVVDVPDVTVGGANVDEARRTLSQTRGLFVTRGAFEQLSQRVSAAAQASAAAEANKPERIAQARDYARQALRALLETPLTAAGVTDARVLVTFPHERRGPAERWDMSRTPEQVLANSR